MFGTRLAHRLRARHRIGRGENMSKSVAIGFTLASFSALTLRALEVHGYFGFFAALLATPAGILAFADLVIALSLAALWMWNDARERELPVWPYLALTLVFGSAGPLAYLLHRELRARTMSRVLI
jgi:hypothetical protein